jgi:hypothetical protein
MSLSQKQKMWLEQQGGRGEEDTLRDGKGYFIVLGGRNKTLLKKYIPGDDNLRIKTHNRCTSIRYYVDIKK